ncbi:MAG: 1-acyl-sn-glycerol-3-phosphate acyltransferase [Cyanobacteria bacterium SIG28]|nr:1-acyl-sn-glycerol-3-phosphate acyltransferase [Cyanobacteria bacterium SIG28]
MTAVEKKKKVKQDARDQKFFNRWRRYFQFVITHIFYMIRLKLVYRLEVYGKENIPKSNEYIVAPNHLSTLDPPMIASVFNRPIAYMAKKELFKNPFMRWWLNWLGSFAVDREHLSISTIRTVLTIKKTDWVFGIFPQGTRQEPGVIHDITKGFASLAKSTKCGILPVGIVGAHKALWMPFKGKIVIKIGEVIPYSDNVEEMVEKWTEAIQELTGFKYEPTLA